MGKNDKQIDRQNRCNTVIITAHVFRKYVINHKNCNGIICNIFCMSHNKCRCRLYFAQTVTLTTNAMLIG